jgi:superfamily II DNA or RNA helicase
MTIALRDYQKECVETVLNESKAGVKRQLITLPTGAGKTVVMSAIAKELNQRTLVLAHREELISQAVEKFKLFWPGVSIGVCMAERDEIACQVVIGSVQSCSRPKRLARLKEQGFSVLFIDEAHHTTADSYQVIINELGFAKESTKLLIGVTATPQRSDKQGLGETFDKITFSRSIGTMIKAGYLSPVHGRKILTSFVLQKMRTSNGDFAIEDLDEAVNTPERNAFIAEKYQAYAPNRKAVAFCVDVRHCQDLAEAFRKRGINSQAVWGDMGGDERKNALEGLKSGRIQVATSCGVLIEGFDEPSISAIVMARPTKSKSLYTQSVGRGLRLYPGKDCCLVMDFTDRGHNLDSIMTLNSMIPEALNVEERQEGEAEEIDKTPKIEVWDEVDKEFDILGCARFLWIQIGDGQWSLLDDEKREIVMSPSGDGYVATLYFPLGLSSQIVTTPLPLEYCSGVCEDYARRNLKIAFADTKAPWMSYPAQPTQGQRDFLAKNNAWREGMSKADASLAIRKSIAIKNKQRRQLADEPITHKQRYALIQHGIDPKDMSKLEAMQAISKIKQGQLQC